jgi:hypothetical protein
VVRRAIEDDGVAGIRRVDFGRATVHLVGRRPVYSGRVRPFDTLTGDGRELLTSIVNKINECTRRWKLF